MLASQVEAVAGQHADGLILRGMVDLVFAHELELAVPILGIEAHLALRQRHPEFIDLGVLELTKDLHLTGRGHATAITSGALEDVDALRLNTGGTDELDLLGLLVPQGRRIAQRVEVEFVERLLRHHLGTALAQAIHGHGSGLHRVIRLHSVYIARHEFDLGIGEGHPALVVHRHPADDVQDVALLGGDEVVASLPRETTAQIGYLGVNLTRRTGV